MSILSSHGAGASGIAFRSLKPLEKKQLVILGIPGGPGISGAYLDASTTRLAQHLGANAIVIDLPNHGASTKYSDHKRRSYLDAREALAAFITELVSQDLRLIFYGHSLGGLIAMDLATLQTPSIQALVLVSVPTSDEINAKMTEGLRARGADCLTWPDEAAFGLWWRRVIDLYLFNTNAEGEDLLTGTPTVWKSNEWFRIGLPSFATLAGRLLEARADLRLIYVEGADDIIVPPKNADVVIDHLPSAAAVVFSECGHFPMLEQSVQFEEHCGARLVE